MSAALQSLHIWLKSEIKELNPIEIFSYLLNAYVLSTEYKVIVNRYPAISVPLAGSSSWKQVHDVLRVLFQQDLVCCFGLYYWLMDWIGSGVYGISRSE